jgi:hypothetical protein
MREMGHASCKADADVWLKRKTRPDDRFQHHMHTLCHVDNVLATHHAAMMQTRQINKRFPLKAESVGDPDVCLGANLRKATLDNGVKAWSMSPSNEQAHARSHQECQEPSSGEIRTRWTMAKESANTLYEGLPTRDRPVAGARPQGRILPCVSD